jgi:hypothetical protein
MSALLALEEERIEQLRDDLVALATEKGTFADQTVLELSQKLDEYLVRFLRLCREKK